MAKYTFEDIEILRQKSGISYEEAVNLLEYHNGSLARALVDLEKNGRLKTGPASGDAGKGAKGVFTFLYRLRPVSYTHLDRNGARRGGAFGHAERSGHPRFAGA